MSLGARQRDARPARQVLGRQRPMGHRRQLHAFVVRQNQGNFRASQSHTRLLADEYEGPCDLFHFLHGQDTSVRMLSLVALLTIGGVLMVGGATLAAADWDLWSFVSVLGASMILCGTALCYASYRIIANRVLNVVEAVREILASEDYSIRVTKPSAEAVGLLVDDLNQLLEQMESRRPTPGRPTGGRSPP